MQASAMQEGLSAFTVLRALRRRKFFFLIPVLLVTAGAAFYALRMPTRYRAQALIVAQPRTTQSYIKDRPDPAPVNVQEQMYAIRGTLLSGPVLETVLQEFGPLGSSGSPNREQPVDVLRSKISIQVEAPDAFHLRVDGDDPKTVMRATNRLAQLFVERVSDQAGRNVEDAAALLDAQIAQLRRKLDEQDTHAKAYRAQAATELPEQLATDLKMFESLQMQLQSLSGKITDDEARRSAALTEMKELEKEGALQSPAPQAAPTVAAAPSGPELALENLRMKLRELQARYTPQHPEVLRTQQEIRSLEQTIANAPAKPQQSSAPQPGARAAEPSPARLRYVALKAEQESIDQRLKGYQREQSAASSQISVYERRLHSAPQYQRELAERIKDADFTRSQYEQLLRKREEVRIDEQAAKNSRQNLFRVAEPATLPNGSLGLSPKRLILMAFLASMGLGLLVVLAIEQMDTSFDTVESFQGFTTMPIWSVVPNISTRLAPRQVNGNGSKHFSLGLHLEPKDNGALSPIQIRDLQKQRVVTLSSPDSVAAEQYAMLAMKVRRWSEQSGAQMLAVTSSAGSEGKSLNAVNLAVALASTVEEPALLVDCDLRRPRVHQYLGIRPTVGLSDLLAKPDAMEGAITRIGNLHIISGGSIPLNPVGLLTSRRAQEFFGRLRKEYRFVVLDSPPMMPIVDSHILANLADGVLVVVRARTTRRELLRHALETLDASNVLGVVFNDIEYKDSRYAYAYKYYQKHYLGRS